MYHSFNTNPGRNTFGVFKEPLNSGDYIYNKKAKASFCRANRCIPSKKVNSSSNLLLLRRSNFLSYYACSDINTADLNINLLTTLDLSNIPVIESNSSPYESPVDLSFSATPYTDYSIDPSGNLFGNTACGFLNYEKYLVPNTGT
jgi:hypothetical protein